MSWRYATSTDLSHWEHKPVALLAHGYPGDITEMFFSGAAVADTQNTSGFGTSGKVPFVALYTSYYPNSRTLPSGKSVNGGTQAQSIAYSLDEGMTWTTYDVANPVVPLPPASYQEQWRDFRNPFVFWHAHSSKWISIISLAQLRNILVYTSPNLKDWTYISEYGPECINLKVQGQVVRTATGINEERLLPKSWDFSNLISQTAVLGIVDSLTGSWGHILIDQITFMNPPSASGLAPNTAGLWSFNGTGQNAIIEIVDSSISGWGHILIDEITFSNASPEVSLSRWIDFGPDFYAAVPFNGLPATSQVGITWMIDDRATLAQQPVANLTSLETLSDYTNSWGTVAEGTQALPLSGKTLDITITFSDRPSVSLSPQFGLMLRATSDLGQQTWVGYDFDNKRLFVDRTKSGNAGFDGTFSNTYYAPLAPASNGQVTLRILLDWSSVEIFGGEGEATLTTQIFPNDNGVDVRLFSTGGGTSGVKINAKSVGRLRNGYL
ncbi:putative inulinase precursor [Halenospora varia]|nr:putative inulinase precursor [Halenospora varia]